MPTALRMAAGITLWLAAASAARADNFAAVYYDGNADELVVTMRYRGTNPDHAFTITWGECKDDDASAPKQLSATIDDSQWNDAARAPFKKTTRFPLAGVSCRPAVLTLHTAPRFYYQVNIPAAPAPAAR